MGTVILSGNIFRHGFKGCRLGRTCYFSTLVPDKKNGKLYKMNDNLIYSSQRLENDKINRVMKIKIARKLKVSSTHVLDDTTPSISLKYLTEKEPLEETTPELKKGDNPCPTVLPIGLKVVSPEFVDTEQIQDDNATEKEVDVTDRGKYELRDGSTVSVRKFWKNDYPIYTHNVEKSEDPASDEWVLKYGTSNSKIPQSHVPCGGCGALLHCTDPSIPGFIPQEIFTECKPTDLRAISCQRCYFLQNHDTALQVAVNSKVYPRIISHIKSKKSLVLLAIDLMDFPCSIWPGITDIVGLDCPMFLVGNKVDLLWGDGKGWLTRVEKSLRKSFHPRANIIGTQLISAKTGFGVEELVSKLQDVWRYRGDVYLVGCTNVGKSTLFNALLQSDYCKVKAADLLQRATTAPWPGTTLNLLKFPILRPEGWRIFLRSERLTSDRTKKMENYLSKQKTTEHEMKSPQLIGHIGRTFHRSLPKQETDAFVSPDFEGKFSEPIPGSGLNANDREFSKGRWFFDTPGVLHEDQILDLLTTDELLQVLPKSCIEPRTVSMKPGWTLFVAGLGRIDYLDGPPDSRKWTIFTSKTLPITICLTEHAEERYNSLLGTETFAIPMGNEERLKKWPSLKYRDDLKFCGISKSICCGDIILSSCGWVSFAPDKKEIISVRPWTPEGRGIFARSPALLPYAVQLRGDMIKGSPAFSRSNVKKTAYDGGI